MLKSLQGRYFDIGEENFYSSAQIIQKPSGPNLLIQY